MAEVAPRAGAWVETSLRVRVKPVARSHPVRVRGLKQIRFAKVGNLICVAPRAGAWVETQMEVPGNKDQAVAPRAGAWVETERAGTAGGTKESHPVRVRGLKPHQA